MSQPLIKPHQVDQLPFLDAQQKAQYKNGLANLWQAFETSPEGSQAKNDARQKLQSASAKIMQSISARGRPAPGVAGQPRPPQNGQGGQQPAQQSQNAQPPTQPQPQSQAVVGQPSVQDTDQDAAIKAKITAEVASIPLYPSNDITTHAQFETYKTTFKQRYGMARMRSEKAKFSLMEVTRQIQQIQQTGQQIPMDLQQKHALAKKTMDEQAGIARDLVEANNRNKIQAQARKPPNPGNRQTPVNGDATNAQRPQAQQGMSGVQQDVQMTNSPAQPQAPAMPQPPQQRMPMQNQQQPGQQQPQRSMPQQPMQQPQRPPINAQLSGQFPQQYPGAPNSAIPQSANPAQQPTALSQQGAIAKAQEQNFRQNTNPQQQQQQQLQQPPTIPNGGFNQPPPQGTPTSTTPTQTQAPLNSKFPIPKSLSLGPQSQTPVAGPAPRPTMANQGGMMAAPGIAKPPVYTLEGEGDHVLSKRKLDELVRQVTGSSDPADGLTPEMEEAVLSMTDDFIDNVITKACQMAKLRQGSALDIRDLQLVLERNYGIRIPGYSLDEARSVRKFQPGPGWVSKLQAVNASKVMGSSKDP